MRLNIDSIKWWIGLAVAALFISFAITLPSVSAQEGTPPVPTATPTGTLGAETGKPLTNTFNTYNLTPRT